MKSYKYAKNKPESVINKEQIKAIKQLDKKRKSNFSSPISGKTEKSSTPNSRVPLLVSPNITTLSSEEETTKYYKVYKFLHFLPQLNDKDRVIYSILLDKSNYNLEYKKSNSSIQRVSTSITNAHLAERTGYDKDTIAKSIKRLALLGLIEIEGRNGLRKIFITNEFERIQYAWDYVLYDENLSKKENLKRLKEYTKTYSNTTISYKRRFGSVFEIAQKIKNTIKEKCSESKDKDVAKQNRIDYETKLGSLGAVFDCEKTIKKLKACEKSEEGLDIKEDYTDDIDSYFDSVASSASSTNPDTEDKKIEINENKFPKPKIILNYSDIFNFSPDKKVKMNFFYKLNYRILNYPDLDSTDKLLYTILLGTLSLKQAKNKDTLSYNLSRDFLTKALSVSERTLLAHLKKLKDLGLIDYSFSANNQLLIFVLRNLSEPTYEEQNTNNDTENLE